MKWAGTQQLQQIKLTLEVILLLLLIPLVLYTISKDHTRAVLLGLQAR